MQAIGFDNNKYLRMQSEKIRERISQFGGKLYLEFGGKLFDDYHASRVLPGFALSLIHICKTLVAVLPAYLNALTGEGVHIVTVNDYLARRDSEWMGKVYRFLGLSVGLIVHDMSSAERQQAYAAAVSYTHLVFDRAVLRAGGLRAAAGCSILQETTWIRSDRYGRETENECGSIL